MAKALENKLKTGLTATYICYAGLIVLFGVWGFFRSSGHSLALFALQAGPLLLLLPGMVKRYHRSFTWLCFVILFYFIKSVEGVFMSTATPLDVVFLVLTVALFIIAMFTSRWLQHAQLQPA